MAKPRLDDPLTAEQLRAVLDYIPATGMFWWRDRPGIRPSVRARLNGRPAGTTNSLNGYIYIGINGRLRLAHRLAFLWMTGQWPHETDHIDGDRTNNAWANLREVTRSQNSMNHPVRSTNKSGAKGVFWHKRARKWQAEIKRDGSLHYLGLFLTFEEAKAARDVAADMLFGEFERHD